MDDFEEINKNRIAEIISITKLISLIFCSIIIYRKLSIQKMPFRSDIYSMAILCSCIFLTYWLWSFSSKMVLKFKNKKEVIILENLCFVIVFTILILFSDGYVSQYKYLYLFIILASTIQSGITQGLITAFISSFIILLMDLVYVRNVSVNTYFENDIIMAAVFILTAWTLGHYVKIENDRLNETKSKLKDLNNELIEKDTQRKHIEEILLKNEVCYNLLFENSKGAIIVHRDNKIVYTNESAAKLLGINSKEDNNDKLFLDFIPKNEKDTLSEIFDKIYNEAITVYNIDGNLINVNGKLTAVQNTSTYFNYEGQSAILSILFDISSEKEVEQLKIDVERNVELLNETREFNESIIELFSNISHELKTPLNVIFSAVQVLFLNKDNYDEFMIKKDKYLHVMKQNCYRLMRLINNFLDITKLDSGFTKLNLANYNIVSLVEDITLSVASYMENNDIELIFDTNIEEKVMAIDPDKMERIMLNLLSNAFKYSRPDGKIYVNLIDEEDFIVISVKDTGIGIPEDKVKLIFERFGQVDKTLKRICEGTGIGLSLVKSFVEMHGGVIELISSPNVGSEFIIKLPTKKLPSASFQTDGINETNIERINIEFSDIYVC